MNSVWPRAFAYGTGVPMFGAFFYAATHGFYQYVEYSGPTNILVLLAFAGVIGNLCYAFAKRFTRKSYEWTHFPYVLGVLFVLPTIIQIALQPEISGVIDSQPMLFSTLLLASAAGSYVGIQKGSSERDAQFKNQEHQITDN